MLKHNKTVSVLMVGFAILLIMLFSGCATLFTGTKDTITIESEPPGAKIYIEGIEYGKTPATLILTRPGFSEKMVTLKLKGYEHVNFVLQKEFNTVAILNLGSVFGWLIDIGTGSIYKYSPRYYKFTLEKAKNAYRMASLKKDRNGNIIVPADSDEVYVKDEKHGMVLVFKK